MPRAGGLVRIDSLDPQASASPEIFVVGGDIRRLGRHPGEVRGRECDREHEQRSSDAFAERWSVDVLSGRTIEENSAGLGIRHEL